MQINRVSRKNKNFHNIDKITEKKYMRCGYFISHSRDNCLALNTKCKKCHKLGHYYTAVCKNKSVRGVAEEETTF